MLEHVLEHACLGARAWARVLERMLGRARHKKLDNRRAYRDITDSQRRRFMKVKGRTAAQHLLGSVND